MVVAFVVPIVMGAVVGYLAAGRFIMPAPKVIAVTWQLPERDVSTPAQSDTIEIAALAPLYVVDHEPIEVAATDVQVTVPDVDEGYGIIVDPPGSDPELAVALNRRTTPAGAKSQRPSASVVADDATNNLPVTGAARQPHDIDIAYDTDSDLPVAGRAHSPNETEFAYAASNDLPVAGMAHAPHAIDGASWQNIDPRSLIHVTVIDRSRLLASVSVDVASGEHRDMRLEDRREASTVALAAAPALPDPPLPTEPPDLPVAAVQIEPNTYDEALVLPEAFDTEFDIYRAPDPVAPGFDGAPIIAIVIDDLGLNRRQTAAMSALPGPLTMAFIPYAEDLAGQAAAAHSQGHEIFLHLPMEPIDPGEDPGPNALMSSLSDADLQVRLIENLNRFTGYVGVNNHMGSRLTQDDEAMAIVMTELKRRDLLFLDSVTIARSAAHAAAIAHGVPSAQRDVFIDNNPNVPAILHQLALLETVAMNQGYAIAIGHPHAATVSALSQWLPLALERGFRIVPVSQIITRRAIILAHYADERVEP